MAMTAQELRERLRKLPPDTLFNSSLADLFVGISQEEGRKRRRSPPPPPNPFKGRHKNNQKASLSDIVLWEKQWRQHKVQSLIAQVFAQAALPEVRDYGKELRAKLLWMVTGGQVMGSVDDLPTSLFDAADPSALDVRALTLEQALLQRWQDPDEQDLWVARFRAGNRFLEAALERRVLALRSRSDQKAIAVAEDPPPL